MRLPSNVVHVPEVKQETGYSCGAAALLSILRFWKGGAFARVREQELYGPLATTCENGTEPEPMTAFLRAEGLDAEYRHGDVTLAELERAVDRGEPPIVDFQAWRDHPIPWRDVWDAGHYAILVGYDAEHLYFMDPSILTEGAYAYLPRAELDERWHDLAGPENRRLERMAVFVRGAARWTPPEAYGNAAAVRLG